MGWTCQWSYWSNILPKPESHILSWNKILRWYQFWNPRQSNLMVKQIFAQKHGDALVQKQTKVTAEAMWSFLVFCHVKV